MHINAQKQHIALLIHLGHRINSPESVEIKNEIFFFIIYDLDINI